MVQMFDVSEFYDVLLDTGTIVLTTSVIEIILTKNYTFCIQGTGNISLS